MMSIFFNFLSFFFQKVIQVKKPAAEEIENSSFELWDVGTLLFTRRLFKQASTETQELAVIHYFS
jgi:hypothetical protein